MNYIKTEITQTKQFFDLNSILEFQLKNNIEIIRGLDLQYQCLINNKCYASSLTPLHSLVVGIKRFKDDEINPNIKH